MQLSRTLGGCTNTIHNREFPTNSIILTLDNKVELVCHKFNRSRKNKLEVYMWIPLEKKWVITYMKNKYTDIMCDYYRVNQKKKKRDYTSYSQLMKHDRTHKSGGGGSRINTRSITDYECTKNPLHDFRRCYY
jgi:hypothetical protein